MITKITFAHLSPYLSDKLEIMIIQCGFPDFKDFLTRKTIQLLDDRRAVILPILYPLARLTEEAFSGKLYIEEIVNDTEQHCDAYDEWVDSYIDNPLPERILQAPYEVVLELLKQHYNVFDLAPNLYIDKSTIKQ